PGADGALTGGRLGGLKTRAVGEAMAARKRSARPSGGTTISYAVRRGKRTALSSGGSDPRSTDFPGEGEGQFNCEPDQRPDQDRDKDRNGRSRVPSSVRHLDRMPPGPSPDVTTGHAVRLTRMLVTER